MRAFPNLPCTYLQVQRLLRWYREQTHSISPSVQHTSAFVHQHTSSINTYCVSSLSMPTIWAPDAAAFSIFSWQKIWRRRHVARCQCHVCRVVLTVDAYIGCVLHNSFTVSDRRGSAVFRDFSPHLCCHIDHIMAYVFTPLYLMRRDLIPSAWSPTTQHYGQTMWSSNCDASTNGLSGDGGLLTVTPTGLQIMHCSLFWCSRTRQWAREVRKLHPGRAIVFPLIFTPCFMTCIVLTV